MGWDNEPIEKIQKEIAKTETELRWCDLASYLMDDEPFQEWFEERFFRVAKSLALEAIRRPKTNADRHAASGILRFVEQKKLELSKFASRKFREELTKRLEVLYDETKRRREPKSRGRKDQLPFGTF